MDINKPRYTPMSRRRRIYEGKAKVLYEGPEPGTLIQHFKDDATAFNAKKHEVIEGKGVLNNRISEFIMERLSEIVPIWDFAAPPWLATDIAYWDDPSHFKPAVAAMMLERMFRSNTPGDFGIMRGATLRKSGE